jgi:(p)ppGpp synthase/HD superfamily hydrolase
MSEPEAAEPILSARFDDALAYASDVHRRQLRRGKDVPYLAHCLDVASLVLFDGGREDEAVAALLHDAVDDVGGIPVLNEIRRRFGGTVADLIAECSDHDPAQDKPTWRRRKEAYLEALASKSAQAQRVCLADKLANAREILADYRQVGEQLWRRYSAERDVLWYLAALADCFEANSKSPMAHELRLVVDEIHELASNGAA